MKVLGLSVLATVLLSACAGHTHSLIAEESDRTLKAGLFRHEGQDGPAMILELAGTRFEAHGFAISRTQNLAELRRQYFPGKHYDRIFSGSDAEHYVYSAQPELRAENGATLQCSAAWRAYAAPAGHCVTANGTRIEFRFE